MENRQTMQNPRYFFILFLISILLVSPVLAESRPTISAPVPQVETVRVEDISDRAYFDRVLSSLNQAKKSISISMYAPYPSRKEKNPVAKLFGALLAARGRGVEVKLWMNSSFDDEENLDRKRFEPFWSELESKGGKVFWVRRDKRLHDKLIVIDREIVIEGSANWTYAALEKNFESATLIHSKTLAQKKIERLESFPIEKHRTANPFLATFVESPVSLFTQEAFFPTMLEENDREAWDLYFHFLKARKVKGLGPWEFGLEHLRSASRGFSGASDRQLKSRLEKVLKRLERKYRLVAFSFSKKTRRFSVRLVEPMLGKKKLKIEAAPTLGSRPWEGTLRIPLAFYEYEYQKKWGLAAQFVYAISLIMEAESRTKVYWQSPVTKLLDRFHLSEKKFHEGFLELKRDHVLEYAPRKSEDRDSKGARRVTSYKNFPLRSENEKETEVLAIRNHYQELSPEEWSRARAYADLFDAPYNPRVMRQFASLVEKFPEFKLEPAVIEVSKFSPDNSLRNPEFVKKILEKK